MSRGVLLVTRKYPPGRGGMEVFSERLFAGLDRPKHLVALRRGQGWLPIFLPYALYRARRLRGRVDHLHLADAMLTMLAPAFEWAVGAPASATVHGLDVVRGVPGYRPLLRRSLQRLRGRVIAVSSFTAAQVEQITGDPPLVVTNGVDLARFEAIRRAEDPAAARRGLGLPADGPLIVSVGRLVRRKGIAWFIEAVLPRLHGPVVFAVVGGGPNERGVRQAAARDPRVHLLGSAPDEIVDALYSCADLFVAPNVPVPGNPEGYGIAPAEAAAAGLPVLVAELEGLLDMARDTGVPTVPPGDAEAWAAAVRDALAHPERARSRATRSWQDVADDYARTFASIAADQRRAATTRPT